jgi:tRNA threonylcarbamoyladenosine biosynthesis protein TsaE
MHIQFSLTEISQVAKDILVAFPHARCIAFYADMGSGKTTLIHEICNHIGVVDAVSSPTFSIINEYHTQLNQRVFHTDWYRLKGVDDAVEAGVQDVLEIPNAYCFIEWPEIAEALLPSNCLKIKLSLLHDETRLIETVS